MKKLLVVLALPFSIVSCDSQATGPAAKAPASAAPVAATVVKAAPGAFACPVTFPVSEKSLTPALVDGVSKELNKRFEAALGPDSQHLDDAKVKARVAAKPVDPARMAALAEVAGCGALIDKPSGCSAFFDTELGYPLSTFIEMKKTAPLRRQFEAAIAALPDAHQREAAQWCIKPLPAK